MKLLSIAKGEILRSKGRVNVKGLAILLFLAVLLLFFLSSSMKSGESVLRGIYTVGINMENQFLKESLLSDGRFRVLQLDSSDASRVLKSGQLDLYIVERGEIIEIYGSETEKAQGALNALEQAVNYHKLNMLWFVPLEQINDAFPVWVQTHYLDREVEFQYTAMSGAKKDLTSLMAKIEDLKPEPLDEAEHVQRIEDIREEVSKGGKLSVLWEPSVVTLPSLISPPIPLQSALASFLFALPLYLFAQLYSSSMMEERVSRTAQLLLAGPLRRWEILVGKTLVHFLLMMTAMAGITLMVKGGIDPIILLLLAPVALFFLGVSFFSSVISRSFKENSFLIIFASVVFLAYLFFPAMFVDVHVASKISPISLVVERLEREAVLPKEYLFSTLPLYLSAGLLFALGGYMFRDEDLFTQKPVTQKLLEATAALWQNLRGGPVGMVLLSAALVPLAYFFELVLLVLLFQVPLPYSIAAMLLLSGFIEESIKVYGVLAVYRVHKIKAPKLIAYAVLAGVGFFLGEKLLALITLTQITQSLFGAAMFMKTYLAKALTLHASLVVLSTLGILWSKGRINWRFVLALSLAAALHAAYNAYLIGGI